MDEALDAAAHRTSIHCAGRQTAGYRCLSRQYGRLKKDGLIVREEDYEFEDPFFGLWIRAL